MHPLILWEGSPQGSSCSSSLIVPVAAMQAASHGDQREEFPSEGVENCRTMQISLFDRPRRSTSLRLPGPGRLDGSPVHPTRWSGVNCQFVGHSWGRDDDGGSSIVCGGAVSYLSVDVCGGDLRLRVTAASLSLVHRNLF